MSIQCKNCGAEIQSRSKFCSECGFEIQKGKTGTEKERSSRKSNSRVSRQAKKKNDFLNYLSMIIDMEKNIYLQDELLNNLKIKSNSLCQHSAPTEPRNRQKSKDGVHSLLIGLLCIIGAIVCAIAAHAIASGDSVEGWIMFIVIVLGLGAFAGALFGALGILGGVLGIFDDLINNHKIQKMNEQNSTRYQNELVEYNRQMSIEQARKTAIDTTISKVENELKKSRIDLQELYDIGIIYPTYRGWVNVCSLYDYIASGMCKTLEEAYKVLIAHIDAGEILTRLDNIIHCLDEIRINQVTLFDGIQESNKTVERLVSSTDNIADQVSKLHNEANQMNRKLDELNRTSSLTAYYEKRNNVQLQYMNQKNYYSENYAHRLLIDDLPPTD